MLSQITSSHIETMMDKCRSGATLQPHEMAFMLGQLGGFMSENDKLRFELEDAKRRIAELTRLQLPGISG